MPVPVRSLFLAALLALLSTAAPARVFDPATFTLANGMQVVVVENHRAPIASHMVWYKVGAADEPAGKSGIAHLLEHLMFKGTPAVPPGEFSKIVARHGGRDNAFTSSDYTGYFQNIAVDRLDLVMRMEADRMRNLFLADADVLTERDVVQEERRSRTDNNPAALLSERMEAALFVNHPYRRPVIGWPDELANLTREDALAFYRRWYAPNNAILVVAGDVTVEDVRRMAETHYGPLTPSLDLPPRQRASEPPQVGERRLILADERVRQPQWNRLTLAPSHNRGDTSLAPALEVMAEIVGGGSTSRLYRALVIDAKLASSVNAWYDPASFDLSSFGLAAVPAPGVSLERLEAGLDKVLGDLLSRGAPAAEVLRAKERLLAEVTYARDSLHTGARVLGEALTTGQGVDDVESWPDRIRAVNADDVARAARVAFDRNASVTGWLTTKETGR